MTWSVIPSWHSRLGQRGRRKLQRVLPRILPGFDWLLLFLRSSWLLFLLLHLISFFPFLIQIYKEWSRKLSLCSKRIMWDLSELVWRLYVVLSKLIVFSFHTSCFLSAVLRAFPVVPVVSPTICHGQICLPNQHVQFWPIPLAQLCWTRKCNALNYGVEYDTGTICCKRNTSSLLLQS